MGSNPATEPVARDVQRDHLRQLMRRKRTPLKIDRNTAIHEAGHAVVAWHLGLRVRMVTAIPAASHKELVRHARWLLYNQANEAIPDTPRAFERARKSVMIALAGFIAEKRAYPRRTRAGDAEVDFRKAADILMKLDGDGELAQLHLDYLDARTQRKVTLLWPLIKTLADALSERGALNGREIRAVIDAAMTTPGLRVATQRPRRPART